MMMSEKRFTIHKENMYKEDWYDYPFCIKEDGEVVFNTIPLYIAEKVRDKLNGQQATIIKQNEEIKKLKRTERSWRKIHCCNKESDNCGIVIEQQSTITELKEENMQLRKYNKQVKERLEKINGGYGHLTHRNGLTANEWLIESQEKELKKKNKEISDWIERHSKDIAKICKQQATIKELEKENMQLRKEKEYWEQSTKHRQRLLEDYEKELRLHNAYLIDNNQAEDYQRWRRSNK